MTSLSFLPASFSAEKRCKGKHFFSFHQNFFQVFFSGRFSGAVGPRHGRYHPKRGKDASLSSFRGFRSRKRVQKYALYPIPEEKPHIYIYGRMRLHLFMRHKHGEISTRKEGNFYSERSLSHAVGTGNASACVFWGKYMKYNSETKSLFKFCSASV